MKNINLPLLLFFWLYTCLCFAQDTTYYDSNGNEVDSFHLAQEYEIITKNKSDTNIAVEREYYISGQIKSEVHYNPYSQFKKNGIRKEWYENGQLKKNMVYKNDSIEGQLLTYWDNGQLKRKDYFKNGEFIEGNLFDSTGNEVEHYDFMILPDFPGGLKNMMRFLGKEVKYPPKAKRKGIEGRVLVTFIVDIEGLVKDVEVKRGIHELLNNEAVRAVKEFPQLKAGMEDGEKIDVRFNLPINFDMKW